MLALQAEQVDAVQHLRNNAHFRHFVEWLEAWREAEMSALVSNPGDYVAGGRCQALRTICDTVSQLQQQE